MIYEDEMSQQNIKYYKGGLDLLYSKIAMHEPVHRELSPLRNNLQNRGNTFFLTRWQV